jgi:hypothetical protein
MEFFAGIFHKASTIYGSNADLSGSFPLRSQHQTRPLNPRFYMLRAKNPVAEVSADNYHYRN